jgi:transcription antitermination factor NusG
LRKIIPRKLVRSYAGSVPQQDGWFALYTFPRHEKKVARQLCDRDVENFLPLYRAPRHWKDGSRGTLELPLFTGYLFVRCARAERSRVLQLPGAIELVSGTGGEPAVIAHVMVEALRRGLHESCIEPHPPVAVGERVRVRAGAFMGFEGVVIRLKNRVRVVLSVENIMRSFVVDLPIEDVEPSGSSKLHPRFLYCDEWKRTVRAADSA